MLSNFPWGRRCPDIGLSAVIANELFHCLVIYVVDDKRVVGGNLLPDIFRHTVAHLAKACHIRLVNYNNPMSKIHKFRVILGRK